MSIIEEVKVVMIAHIVSPRLCSNVVEFNDAKETHMSYYLSGPSFVHSVRYILAMLVHICESAKRRKNNHMLQKART